MVFGQKIIWGAVQHGQRHIGNVIDYCAQFVAENAAEFIIKQGGWVGHVFFLSIIQNIKFVYVDLLKFSSLSQYTVEKLM